MSHFLIFLTCACSAALLVLGTVFNETGLGDVYSITRSNATSGVSVVSSFTLNEECTEIICPTGSSAPTTTPGMSCADPSSLQRCSDPWDTPKNNGSGCIAELGAPGRETWYAMHLTLLTAFVMAVVTMCLSCVLVCRRESPQFLTSFRNVFSGLSLFATLVQLGTQSFHFFIWVRCEDATCTVTPNDENEDGAPLQCEVEFGITFWIFVSAAALNMLSLIATCVQRRMARRPLAEHYYQESVILQREYQEAARSEELQKQEEDRKKRQATADRGTPLFSRLPPPLPGQASSTSLHLLVLANDRFPDAEVELLPTVILTMIDCQDPHRMPHIEAKTHSRVEVIQCQIESAQVLDHYVAGLAPQFRTAKRVGMECKPRRGGNSGNLLPVAVKAITKFFSAPGSAHTLSLSNASTLEVRAILEAKIPGLHRLCLHDSQSILLHDLVDLVSSHPYIVEMPIVSTSCQVQGALVVTGEGLEHLKSCNVSFAPVADYDEPPAVNVAPPLRTVAIGKEEFLNTTDPRVTVGLVAVSGTVVPLAREKLHFSLLLPGMLAECDDSERLISIDIEPPVSKEAVALAVHFVTHHTSDSAHQKCKNWEAKIDVQNTSDFRYYWDCDLDRFRMLYIRTLPSHKRRVQVLCELMAIAAYLNVPVLKRFVRAALLSDEVD